MKQIATKKDKGKVMVELVDPQFIIDIGKVLTFGAVKYEVENWRKGLPWKRTLGAVLRHILAWARGEDNDPESGLSHLSHAACNLMFLLEWAHTHKELDDRIKTKI